MGSTFLSRHAKLIVLLVLAAAPFFFVGAFRALRSNTNSVEDWLPAGLSATGDLAWFRQHFLGDQFVVVSWDGCELGDDPSIEGARPDDPRLERLARLLVPGDGEARADGRSAAYAGYIKSMITGRRMLTQLTSPPLNLRYADAEDRLRGLLIGPDGRTTCLLITLTDQAFGHFREVIGRGVSGPFRMARQRGILFEAIEECGIDPATVHLGGPPVDKVAIDEEGERTLIRLGLVSALVGVGLAWWSLRSFKLTMIVFACSLFSAAASLATVWWSGATMDAVLMSMPSLVYVLAISGAVHLIHYYRNAVDQVGLIGAPEKAIRDGWKPAVLCSITTAIGLASLYASDLVPIRKFGIYSALGVMGTLVALFTCLPAALYIWPKRTKAKQHRRAHASQELPVPPAQLTSHQRRDTSHSPGALPHAGVESLGTRFWESIGHWIVGHHAAVAAGCLVFAIVVGFGLTRVKTSVNLLALFEPGARILEDYEWLELHLAKLVPMEVVLRFAPPDGSPNAGGGSDEARSDSDGLYSLSFLDRMHAVAMVQRVLDEEFGATGSNVIGGTMSVVTFAPDLPTNRSGTKDFIRRRTTNARMQAHRDEYLRSGYLSVDEEDQSELWRISVRVGAFQGVDYGRFVEDLRQSVQPVLEAYGVRDRILREIVAQRNGESYAGASVCVVSESRDRKSRIFLSALGPLLTKARLKVMSVDGERQEYDRELLSRLATYDGVVLVNQVSSAEHRALRQHARLLIDARGEPAGRDFNKAAGDDEAASNVSAVYTGVVPVVYTAERMLLDSLIVSAAWSFITISPLMMLLARGVRAGMVAMLPNVVPVLLVFGGMGWLGVEVDIGSMMSASIALGIAVDDTVHFLNWFRRDLDRLHDRRLAILASYSHCATPTLQAAVISGLGLSVFALSTFTPTQRFGYLMLTILFAGVIAELILLPALLAGPLGNVFSPGTGRKPRKVVTGDGLATPQGMDHGITGGELFTVEATAGQFVPIDPLEGLCIRFSTSSTRHGSGGQKGKNRS